MYKNHISVNDDEATLSFIASRAMTHFSYLHMTANDIKMITHN